MQVILSFLLVYADLEKGGIIMSKGVYVRVYHDLELLQGIDRCDHHIIKG